MSKKKTNKDWEPWQEHLIGFIVIGLIMLSIYFLHDDVLLKEDSGTKGKAFQKILLLIEKKFGIEYVYGFLSLIMLIAGIKALRSYSKKNNDAIPKN